MPRRRQLALLAALALAAAALADPALAQCAMCKTALTASPEGRSIGEQFNRAILVMIAAPYLVMGALAAVVFRSRLGALAQRLRERLGIGGPRPLP
jgi:hypothetical protein